MSVQAREYSSRLEEVNALRSSLQARVSQELSHSKLLLLKDLEEERLSLYKKNTELDRELLKMNSLNEQISQKTRENERLALENLKLTEETGKLREKTSFLEERSRTEKENLLMIKLALEKEEERSRRGEGERNMLTEEKERIKKNLEDYREIVEEVKNGRKEEVKRFQGEMSALQTQIERLQTERYILLSKIDALSLQMPRVDDEEEDESDKGGRLGSDFEVGLYVYLFFLIFFL